MTRPLAATLACLVLFLATGTSAQQPGAAPPVEAKREVIVNWTLGDQAWDFKQVLSVYEPIKGSFDPQTRVASWTLQLARDLREGEAGLHTETRDTPFRPILLNAEKTVIANDARVIMTPVSGRAGDTVHVLIQLPDAETLAHVKTIRIERRTNVGFQP